MRDLSVEEIELVGGGTYIPGVGWDISGDRGKPPSYVPYNPTQDNYYSFPGGYPYYVPGRSNTNEGAFDHYSINIINQYGPLTAQGEIAQSALANAISEVGNLMRDYSFQSKTFFDPATGQSFTGAELSRLWMNTDFAITNVDYSKKNGGVGQAHLNNGNPFFEVSLSGLIGYTHADILNPANQHVTDQQRTDGAVTYILHELVHVTKMGDAFNSAISDKNSDAGIIITPAEWKQNESLAWRGAEAVYAEMKKTGFPMTPAEQSGPRFSVR